MRLYVRRDGVNIVTTRCRLLCHDLDCGAESFGDDMASCRNSLIPCGIGELPQQRLSQENSLRLGLRRRCGFCQITLTSSFWNIIGHADGQTIT